MNIQVTMSGETQQDFQQIAEILGKAVEVMKGAKPSEPTPIPKAQTGTTPASPANKVVNSPNVVSDIEEETALDIETIRANVKNASALGHKKTMKEYLTSLGVPDVSSLKPDDYEVFNNQVLKLING